MVIHESAEDYLESILVLQQRRGQVRSIDIVNELGYSKPSVSIAMKKLRENGYISMDADGSITLNAGSTAGTRPSRSSLSCWGSPRRWRRRTPARWSTISARRRTAASGTIWIR